MHELIRSNWLDALPRILEKYYFRPLYFPSLPGCTRYFHFYNSSLRRVLHLLNISDTLFSFLLNEPTLEDRCFKYWCKYLTALSSSVDGNLILENANFNYMRNLWLGGEFSINSIRKSKRFIYNRSTIEKVCEWLSSLPTNSSIINYEIDEILLLGEFPDSFLNC